MDKLRFEEAQRLMDSIKRFNDYLGQVDKTDTIYYRTPDMDGGYTSGRYIAFYESEKGDIKEAIKSYYQTKIQELEKQFEEL